MKTPLIDIIIVTYDNIELLLSCIKSYEMSLDSVTCKMVRFIVVNNGNPVLEQYLNKNEQLLVLNPGRNLGWEGGLNYGLKHSKSPFVIFSNDDIRLLTGQKHWLWKIISTFNDPKVGAVGPCSNFVMGAQNIFMDHHDEALDVKYLIGFFMVLRREALDKAGGVDESLPGGDDIDLSIRLRDVGYTLVVRRDVFVYHHGQVTGQKVHQGYWNSPKMQEATNHAIIRKHGMNKFYETMVRGYLDVAQYGFDPGFNSKDSEGDICRKHVEGDKILELGCGEKKTVPNAIGIDIRDSGDLVPFVSGKETGCVADIKGDVSVNLPVEEKSQDTIIARHILEHCQDSLGTLSCWNRSLKVGGKLIIACPNQQIGHTVLMNPEHIMSFTPSSLRNLAGVCGFAEIHRYEDVNGVSFVSVFQKHQDPYFTINEPEPTVSPLASREVVCA